MKVIRFCGDKKSLFGAPVTVANGRVVATDGHIFVCVPIGMAQDAPSAPQTHAAAFLELANTCMTAWLSPTVDAGRVDEIPTPDCEVCNGVGTDTRCPDCHGAGSFEWGSHEYDCQECDGTGRTAPIVCAMCRGTGRGSTRICAEGVGDDKSGVSTAYIALIAAELPNARIFRAPNDKGHYFFADVDQGVFGAVSKMVKPCGWKA